ncbi:MAG: SAM-dependent methyltransferase, partial [Methylophilaceae bacterium]
MIPVGLGDENLSMVIPEDVMQLVRGLEYFVVENEKSARRFLSAIKTNKPVRELNFQLLNEHTLDKDLPVLIAPLLAGNNMGMLSEAGCPGIADPGAILAELAHKKGAHVA